MPRSCSLWALRRWKADLLVFEPPWGISSCLIINWESSQEDFALAIKYIKKKTTSKQKNTPHPMEKNKTQQDSFCRSRDPPVTQVESDCSTTHLTATTAPCHGALNIWTSAIGTRCRLEAAARCGQSNAAAVCKLHLPCRICLPQSHDHSLTSVLLKGEPAVL